MIRKGDDPVILAERHLRIFAVTSPFFADYAYQTINIDGLSVSDILVFGVDMRSSWARIFPDPPEDFFSESELSGQDMPIFCGTISKEYFAGVVSGISQTLLGMVSSPNRDPALVKCMIFDDGGVTLHHVEPAPMGVKPKYLN